MTTAITLNDAIDRSRSHNEIVSVEHAGDIASLRSAVSDLYDGEIDDVRENEGTIDVWGYRADMPEGEMDWRLKVTLLAGESAK